MILSLAAVQATSAQVCTGYVNATDGDDSNSGTIFSPLRSLEFAFNTMPTGSIVCIAAGEYFSGLDADGIELTASGKNMEFVLNAFAGETEVRFSESSFRIDVGTGSITFRAGSSTNLVFGRGIINSNAAGESGLLHFLHTLRFVSGIVRFESLTPRIENSVGVPGYINPDNNQKIAPASAVIELGGEGLTVIFDYEAAIRSYLFSGKVAPETGANLPSDLLDSSRLVFDSESDLVSGSPLNLANGSARFLGTGSVSFVQDVRLNVEAGKVDIAGNAGPVDFRSTLLLVGESNDREIIQHAGSGILSISRLALEATSVGGDREITVRILSTGTLRIETFAATPSAGGFSLLLNIINDAGVLDLGNDTIAQQLPGFISNTGFFNLRGSLNLGQNFAGLALQNGGTIKLNGFDLSLLSSASLINNGVIRSPGQVILAGPTTITGTGEWPLLLVTDLLQVSGNSTYTDDISLSGSGRLVVSANTRLEIDNDLLASSGAIVTLNENSRISVTRDISLIDVEIVLRPDTELALGRNLDVGSSLFTDRSGIIRFTGQISQQLSAAPESVLPALQINQSTVHLPPVAGTGMISVLGGVLIHTGQAGPLSVGGISIANGSLSLAANPLIITDPIHLNGGSIFLGDAAEVQLTGDLIWNAGSLTLPTSGLSFSGGTEQLFSIASPQFIPGLSVSGTLTRVIIDGSVELDSTLDLKEGRIILEAGSTLSVRGDVLRSTGLLVGPPESTLRLSGTSVQTISGFSSTVLPSLILEAGIVLIPDNLSVSGDLSVLSGAMVLQAGSTIMIEQSLVVDGGTVTLETDSAIRVTNDVLFSSGRFETRSGTTLTVGGDLVRTEAVIDMVETALVFNGRRNQIVSTNAQLDIKSLSVTGAGTRVDLLGTDHYIVKQNIDISTGAELSTGTTTIQLTGDFPGAGLSVEGVLSGSKDGVIVSGPADGTVQFTLSGSGIFGPLTVDLDDENGVITGSGASTEFVFSGPVRFLRGGIDVAGRAVRLSAAVVFPSLERNITSSVQDPEQLVGGWFTDSTGPLIFNPDETPYDLIYSGELSLIYLPNGEFPPDQIRNVTINAVDIVNSPAVFGVMLPHSVSVSGDIRIAEGALLRLDQFDITATSAQKEHQIDGTISGAGSFHVRGDASSVFSPARSGMVETLIISNPAPLLPVLIQDISGLRSLDIVGGGARISGTGLSANPFHVTGRISVTNGTLFLDHPTRVGTTQTAGQVSLSAGSLRFKPSANLIMGPGSLWEADENSSVVVDDLPSGTGKSAIVDGFIVFEGGGQLNSAVSIPRIRLEANSSGTGSDDLLFASDVTVTDIFELIAGDVILGEYDLLFEGSLFRKEDNSAPLDGGSDAFYGDFEKDAGRVVFTQASTLELNSDLQFFSARLQIAADPDDEINIVSPADSPFKIILFDRPFVMQSGSLNIGLNDIVLKAAFSPAFIASGGTIIASSLPVLPARRSSAHNDPSLFPYDDSRYGEIILGGSGSSSVQLTGTVTVPNFTVDGTVSLDGVSGQLRVSSRLSYGRAGATLLTGSDGRVRIGDGAVILRRGSGTISHPLTFEGEVDLFYDLDDGSVSGVNSEFGPAVLQTSLELPGIVRNLGIMAGHVNGVSNGIDLSAPLSITGTLSLFSGQLITDPEEITLVAGSRLILDEVDEDSPAVLGPGSLASSGLTDLTYTIRFSDLSSSDALIPNEGTDIDSLVIELGEDGLINPVEFVLHRNISTVTMRSLAPVQGSSINLAGNTITTAGDMNIMGGFLHSGPLARLLVGGDFVLGPDARVHGAVSADIAGTAHIGGLYEGLELRIGGDLNVSSPLGPSLNVIFSGSQQRLFAGTDLSIATLEINQKTIGEQLPTLIIDSNLPSITLSVLNNLLLRNGIIITGTNDILLAGAAAGFTRDVNIGDESHVLGMISLNAPDNSTSTFIFPVGDLRRYRPLSLTFSDPLLSKTLLSVVHQGSTPVGIEGLPVEFSDGNIVRGLAAYSWTLFSSVNFAQSQPVDIRAIVEQTGQTPSAHRLIGRDFANISNDWRELAPENTVELEPGMLVLETKSVRGALSPAGLELSVGVPESAAFDSRFQFVHGDVEQDNTTVSLVIDGQLVFSSINFNNATRSVTISLSSTLENKIISVFDSGSGEAVTEAVVQFADGSGIFTALLSDGSAQSTLAGRTFSLDPPSPGSVAIQPVNGSADLDMARLRDEQQNLILGPVEPGTIGEEMELLATNQLLTLTSGEIETFVDSYQFDFSPFEGQHAHLLYSGNNPGVETSSLTAQLILPDGSVFPLRIVTGIDDFSSGPIIPEGLALHQNYPNPFSQRTTLRFDLSEIADVRVVVYDILGRIVSTIEAGLLPAAAGLTVSFDGSHLASGLYLYRLEARSQSTRRVKTGKMLLVR